MANLVFYDASHTYKLDGEELPSVSEVIRFISREVYGTVNQYTLDNAAERGTKVHKLTEALDKYGSCEAPEDLVGYIKAYVKFRKDHQVEWQKIEYATHHPDRLYAGTIDRIGLVDGKLSVVDIKSSYAVQKPLCAAQLNLYRMMLTEEVQALYIAHLRADGTYKLVEIPIDGALATACLTLHQALKKKPRKKKQEVENA